MPVTPPSPYPRPLVAVSLKMYFSTQQTRDWINDVISHPQAALLRHGVDLVLLPTFVAIEPTRRIINGGSVALGAQNLSAEHNGPYTGEVSATMLVEAGCAFVEVGHAERRALFGEDDQMVARKVQAAVCAHLTPIICIGESEPGRPSDAATTCVRQTGLALEGIDHDIPVVLAYEPVWAIGASRVADAGHVTHVAAELRKAFAHRKSTRIIYGGTAGPGTFRELAQAVDGLFLGRRAHAVEDLYTVLEEVTRLRRSSGT